MMAAVTNRQCVNNTLQVEKNKTDEKNSKVARLKVYGGESKKKERRWG